MIATSTTSNKSSSLKLFHKLKSVASINYNLLQFRKNPITLLFLLYYLNMLDNMTRLSVNINKIATLRNSRGGNVPNLLSTALACERFGAQGITVHPRPDERHIRYQDVYDLKANIETELNIEGNCQEPRFVELVLKAKPAQVTLVPDNPRQITSNHGWDTVKHEEYLKEMCEVFQKENIRVSIFVDPDEKMVEGAAKAGADRVELYTEEYAIGFHQNKETVIKPYFNAAVKARELGIGLNAGHDLDLHNLAFFNQNIPDLLEVSIGHALISDALFLGLEETIKRYRAALK